MNVFIIFNQELVYEQLTKVEHRGLGGVVVRTLVFNLLSQQFEYWPSVAQNNVSPKKCMGMQNFARELAIFCIPLQTSASPCKIMYFFCFDTWEKMLLS